MESANIINGDCWVAYFDMVGFTNDINEHVRNLGGDSLYIYVDIEYRDILETAKDRVNEEIELNERIRGKIEWISFSDTFIFYAAEDSNGTYDCYLAIDRILRLFFYDSLLKGILFKGALSFGPFYADKKNNIFLGPALIDAYKYAEKQDWACGVVITPDAHKKLTGTDLDAENQLDYAKYRVPYKKQSISGDKIEIVKVTKDLFAYRIAKWFNIEEDIEQKKKELELKDIEENRRETIKRRYDDVLNFIRDTKLH